VAHGFASYTRKARVISPELPVTRGKKERPMTVASRSSGPEEGVFRLLVPPSDTVSSEAALIDVAGQRWQVVDHGAVPFPARAPEYTCVSYSWAGGRTPNPFDPERPMSSRALPALETAIAALRPPPPAIWLDAACMPTQEPARSLCLRSMGAIYAAASGVLAVLSPSASALLDKIRREEAVGSDELRLLEADDWVSRAWTYQEMVNCKIISFVAEGDASDRVSGSRLLNAVGHAIAQRRKAEQVDAYEFRTQHRNLDGLETLIDDWLRADYAERSAYQIMNAMVGRAAVYPDYFNAMVGAITSAPSADRNDAALSPPEYFMRVCEQKGDFSFIYSSAPRASGDAGGWRPRPGPLPPIVPLPSVGEQQTGELHPASLRLHNMASAALGQLDGAARTFVRDWLKTVRSPLPPDIGDAVRETLYRAGFTGCGECLETMCGLFFPQHRLGDAGNCVVFVATDIFFNFGAPGLLLDPAESGTARLRDVGVFVGPFPNTRETVIVR
jgi:heterokaryon incompatibility protein (HET)